MKKEKIKFTGVITKVTLDGRSAVVTLDHEVAGRKMAVISPDTRGRVQLMNGVGRLDTATKVSGSGVKGPDAVRAVTIEKVAG